MKNTVPVFCLLLVIILCKATYTLQQVPCLRPDLNPNVVITPNKTSYGVWSAIQYSCEVAYSYAGPTLSYCYGADPNDWVPDPNTATCSPQCTAPNVDDDVIVTPDQQLYDQQTSVTFSCIDGTLNGALLATCQGDATWDIPESGSPECLNMCSAPANSNGTGLYVHNTWEEFACNSGYQFPDGGQTRKSLCDDGTWSPEVECLLSGCSPPVIPPNVIYTERLAEGALHDLNSKVTFQCLGEMTPVGPEFSYCNTSGDWYPSPLLLQCFAKCEAPSFDDTRISHASVRTGVTSPSYYDNADTIEFTCASRFVEGPRKSTCHEGVWSPNVQYIQPRCKNNCTAPENTAIYGEGPVFLHGYVEIFECVPDPGMVRLGGPRAFCNDGKWKPNVLCKYKTEL